MAFDNLCKLLSEKHPTAFVEWLLGETPDQVEVLKTELSIEPIRADSVIFLNLRHRILHLEFQTRVDSDPPLNLRMLDYWVRLHRLYRRPVTQIIVLLTPPAEGSTIESSFVLEATRHEYRVVPLWEQDPEIFLANDALLPFAPLAATRDPRELLDRTAERVRALESTKQQEVSAYTQILAGLRFDKTLIRQLFRENTMRESVIYQEILQEGLQEGERIGEQRGRTEEGRKLILLQLTFQVGELSDEVNAQINKLSLPHLEDLARALLRFSSRADLDQWLQTNLSVSQEAPDENDLPETNGEE